MVYFEDLRSWISELDDRDQLRRLTRPINKDTELHPIVRWQYVGLPEHKRTGFLFEHVSGFNRDEYTGHVASSVIAPTHDAPLVILGMEDADKATLKKELLEPGEKDPHVVKTGPVKEEIHTGDALLEHDGLDEFPIPIASNGWEILPRITAASCFSKDPETGLLNVGTYNAYRIAPDYTSLRISSSKQTYTHWMKAREQGEPLELAAVIGGPPVIPIVSAMALPWSADELRVACGMADTSIPLVECETVDLAVPATAEVVIEGKLLPDQKENDAPSGEHTGYTLLGGEVNAFQITGITHRENPVWHDMLTGMSPTESSNLSIIRNESPLLNLLQNQMGFEHVKDVRFRTDMGPRQYLCIVQLQSVGGQRPPKYKVWSIAHAILAFRDFFPKYIILVDDDIGINDIDSVLWAVSFRCQPHRDIKIIQGRKSFDQSVAPDRGERGFPEPYETTQGASMMVIDATLNWDYTPVSLPKQEFMENARDLWEELGFTELTPKTPWYGYSLGEWPERLEELVELANTGAFDEVGERLMEMEQAPWL